METTIERQLHLLSLSLPPFVYCKHKFHVDLLKGPVGAKNVMTTAAARARNNKVAPNMASKMSHVLPLLVFFLANAQEITTDLFVRAFN